MARAGQRVTVQRLEVTVDLVVYEAFGRQDDRLVEQVFELNPGLAAKGTYLPLGTVVILPDISSAPRILKTVRLWD